MKKCCLCGKITPVKKLYHDNDQGENVHMACVRKFMSLRADKSLMRKADKFAHMLVEKDRTPPK